LILIPVFFQGDFIVFGYKMVESLIFGFLDALVYSVLPVSQTSPLLLQNKTFITGMSSLEDKMAATTARSIAGSSTLMPPVMLRKTSLAPSLKPALFPELRHIQSLGVVTRRAALRRSVNSCTDQ
jgi:hypothetical protein